LTKPGADTARLYTRLGIAQLDQGNFAGARETFAKVTGARQYIAQLWSLLASQRATPPA
jgi:Flp pilus assembly protein TadD